MARLSATNSTASGSNGHVKSPTEIPITLNNDNKHDEDIDASTESIDSDEISTSNRLDRTLFPGGARDLSFIGLQAFLVGNTFTGGLLLTALLLYIQSPWWRLSAFLSSLSIFHFLEFWTTAHYNTPETKASSFLLYRNGTAYVVAHTSATLEIVLSMFFPEYQKFVAWPVTMAVGAVMVVVFQVLRSVAMAQAGTNFNHQVQSERRDTHELVTKGLYSYFRHPSYFGYFWWAVGTQLMVGNKVCFLAFCVVLWRFFNHRIYHEEKHLVKFFGEKYEDYRKCTGTMIPFIP